MKLYDWPLSPSPRRVRIFLAEKGVDIPRVSIDLSKREQLEAHYRAVNPWCTVPALELDDGTVISEAMAVCRYLEAAYPEPPLMGRTPTEQGVIAMWEHRLEWDGFLAVAETLRNSAERFAHRALTGPVDFEQIPALVERGRKRIQRFFEIVDTRASESEFMAGDSYSVADITALVSVDFAQRAVEIPLPDEREHAWRWYGQVSARPSAQA